MSSGSSPTSSAASPDAILCDAGASITALATEGEESISPMPTMPSSVWTRTISAVLAAVGDRGVDRRAGAGSIASTSVILMFAPSLRSVVSQ